MAPRRSSRTPPRPELSSGHSATRPSGRGSQRPARRTPGRHDDDGGDAGRPYRRSGAGKGQPERPQRPGPERPRPQGAAPAGDPRPRRVAADRQPARGGRRAQRAGLRGDAGDRLARHHRARAHQGTGRRRPRLRDTRPDERHQRQLERASRADPHRHPDTRRTERPDARPDRDARHGQRHRAGDRRVRAPGAGGHARGRQYAARPVPRRGPPRPLARALPRHPGTFRRFEGPVNKVVLAYSGGLDTSVAVAWLKEQFNVEVVTLTVDLGGGSLRPGVEARAISAGASRAYVVDARDRFVTDFVWPHLQANALYQGAYPLATALARPLIAQLLVEVAKAEGADAVAHGCTGKGNDQVRFDVATHALDPGLEVIAPMRVGMGLTRDQEIDYAAERGIEIPITKASPYSIDANLWGRSCETGVLEDPWVTPPADAYEWTVAPAEAPEPIELLLDFEGGVPVALDGERLGSVELVERVHELGGAHGVGRIDHVEDRLVGIKSREIYETPAATILHTAHRALEGLTLSRDTLRFNRMVADELARLIYDGLWFSALSRDLRAYIASSQRVVSGDVRVRLDHGSAVVTGRRSPLSLYDKSLATYDEGDAFDHASAVGFIEIFGLPLRVEAARHGAVGKHHGAAWSWTDPLLSEMPTQVTDPEGAAV